MTSPSAAATIIFNKNRDEIISTAKKEIESQLGSVNFVDYPRIRVWKSDSAVRVHFISSVTLPTENRQMTTTISADFFESQVVVEPKNSEFLFNYTSQIRAVTKLFGPRNRIYLIDQGNIFEAQISHFDEIGRELGAEAYTINKQSLEKRMLWHERHTADPSDLGDLSEAGRGFVEVKE